MVNSKTKNAAKDKRCTSGGVFVVLNLFCILTDQTGNDSRQTEPKQGIVHGTEYIQSTADSF